MRLESQPVSWPAGRPDVHRTRVPRTDGSPRRLFRGVAAGAAVVAIGTAAAAPATAGATGTSSSAARAVHSAYESMQKAKTAHVVLTESKSATGSAGSSSSETMTGTGMTDFATHSFELTFDSLKGGSVQVLETGGILYMKVPPADIAKVPGNKPWVSVDLNQIAAADGGTQATLAGLLSDSPDQAVANLAAATDKISRVGTATIDGSKATEYRATVSLKKAAADSGATSPTIQREESALHTTSIPVEIWVGKKYIERLTVEVPMPSTSSPGGTTTTASTASPSSTATPTSSTAAPATTGHASTTITFTDVGAPVHITAPPATQVASLGTGSTGSSSSTTPSSAS